MEALARVIATGLPWQSYLPRKSTEIGPHRPCIRCIAIESRDWRSFVCNARVLQRCVSAFSEKPRIRLGCPSRSTFSQTPRMLLLVDFGRKEYGYRTSRRGFNSTPGTYLTSTLGFAYFSFFSQGETAIARFGKHRKSLLFWWFSLPFFKKARKRRSGLYPAANTRALWVRDCGNRGHLQAQKEKSIYLI